MFKPRETPPPFYVSKGEFEITDRVLTDVQAKVIKIGFTPVYRHHYRYAASKLQRSFNTAIEGPGEGELMRIKIDGHKKGVLKYLGTFAEVGIAHYEPLVISGDLGQMHDPAIRDLEELNILKGMSQALHDR